MMKRGALPKVIRTTWPALLSFDASDAGDQELRLTTLLACQVATVEAEG